MEFEGAQLMTTELVQAMTVETQPQPVTAVEALIHINNQLNQHEVLLYLWSESWELVAPDHPISLAECWVLVCDLFFVVNMVSNQTGFVIFFVVFFFRQQWESWPMHKINLGLRNHGKISSFNWHHFSPVEKNPIYCASCLVIYKLSLGNIPKMILGSSLDPVGRSKCDVT